MHPLLNGVQTRQSLAADLAALGLGAGDCVMMHAAMRRVGPMLNSPDALIAAALDVVGAAGTVMAYADWDSWHDEFCDEGGRLPDSLKPFIPPFDPRRSRAVRDTMTLLHYAEHCARLPGKRIRRIEVPLATAQGTVWRMIEEFDTGRPVTPMFDAEGEYFARIVDEFLATGRGRTGRVGQADSIVIEAAAIVPFAIAWLEARAG